MQKNSSKIRGSKVSLEFDKMEVDHEPLKRMLSILGEEKTPHHG